MIFKRRFYLIAILLVVFFATVMVVFVSKKDTADNFKGTLVKGYGMEAVV